VFVDDPTLVDRIFDHLDGGTTDLAPDTWREPVAHYRSPARLEREIELVLRRQPVPFCPSAAVPDTGSYLAREAAGVPLVVVRGRDGIVRAFRNACRHRGTAVATDAGCAKSLVCPYHGWVYGLDGGLRHVPDAHGFPDLDPSTRGLVGVAAVEQGGLVFVDQEGGMSASPADHLPVLIEPDQVLLARNEAVVEVNWKVLVEGFLEGYHLKATHRETFFPFGFDNVTVVEASGRHSRITFPFRRIEALRDVPPDERRVDGTVTFVHHVFPNVIVARLSHHTTMVVLDPVAVDRTRFVTFTLARAQDGGGTPSDAVRDTEFVRLGAAEDLAVAMGVQRGLASGANEVLEFGRFEGAITHFHRQLHELVDRAGP
jgi:phenylpropionate dioxygenase-like ring-hydroxylating dioxygenase large terminal subunit